VRGGLQGAVYCVCPESSVRGRRVRTECSRSAGKLRPAGIGSGVEGPSRRPSGLGVPANRKCEKSWTVPAERWRLGYNHHRPHSSLSRMTPAVFAASRPRRSMGQVVLLGARLRLPQRHGNPHSTWYTRWGRGTPPRGEVDGSANDWGILVALPAIQFLGRYSGTVRGE